MNSSRSRRWFLRVGLVAAVFVAAEIIARLNGWPSFPQDPTFPEANEWSYPRYVAKDAELFWRYRPGQTISGSFIAPGKYRINSHGFRGPEFTIASNESRQRVVCLGGSTTFGLGVADGREYPRQLETQLMKLDPEGRQWEVINAGVTNYSTVQGLRLAERWLPQLQPDVVVLNFSWGDHQRANAGIADQDRQMPASWRLAAENALMTSCAGEWLCRLWLTLNPPPPPDTSAFIPVWRVNLTEYNSNIERLTLAAEEAGARCLVASSPISWPPRGMTDSSGVFHYHHRYRRVTKYGAIAAGAEYCEVANYVNLHPEFYESPPTQFELFNADGHTFVADLIARCILGLPIDTARVYEGHLDMLPNE